MIAGSIALAIFDETGSRRANAEWQAALNFNHQQIVELKVGGRGQIIGIHYSRFHEPYLIRIRTNDGFEDHWMHEYEVKQ